MKSFYLAGLLLQCVMVASVPVSVSHDLATSQQGFTNQHKRFVSLFANAESQSNIDIIRASRGPGGKRGSNLQGGKPMGAPVTQASTLPGIQNTAIPQQGFAKRSNLMSGIDIAAERREFDRKHGSNVGGKPMRSQVTQASTLPGIQNTAEDIRDLCSMPLPPPEKFTAFMQRSGLNPSNVLFWSGFQDSVTYDFAVKHGFTSGERMLKPGKKALPGCEQQQKSMQWWDNASAGLAEFAKGSISVLLSKTRHEEILAGTNRGVWVMTELPRLIRKFGIAKSARGTDRIQMIVATPDGQILETAKAYDGALQTA